MNLSFGDPLVVGRQMQNIIVDRSILYFHNNVFVICIHITTQDMKRLGITQADECYL